MPHLAEHVEQHLKPRDPDDEGEFAFGLDLILDGLERIRAASCSSLPRFMLTTHSANPMMWLSSAW